MKKLSRDVLPVAIATAFASVMILVTGSGVADVDVVKDTNEVSLPPPGPFALGGSKGQIAASKGGNAPAAPLAPNAGSSQGAQSLVGVAPVMPAAPNTPNMEKDAPQIGADLSTKVKLPNVDVLQEMKAVQTAEPVLKKSVPGISRPLNSIEAPINLTKKPLLPNAPKVKVDTTSLISASVLVKAQQVVAKEPVAPVLSEVSTRSVLVPMPRQPVQPHQPLSQNYQQIPRGAVAPQIQQYRYVPLPVIQSNYDYNYQQYPSYNGSFPATGYYWVPQKNNSSQQH